MIIMPASWLHGYKYTFVRTEACKQEWIGNTIYSYAYYVNSIAISLVCMYVHDYIIINYVMILLYYV